MFNIKEANKLIGTGSLVLSNWIAQSFDKKHVVQINHESKNTGTLVLSFDDYYDSDAIPKIQAKRFKEYVENSGL